MAKDRRPALALLLALVATAGMAVLPLHKAKLLAAEEPNGAPAPVARTVDRYGDPLPSGALVRMGTVRLRHGEPQLAFAADGKTVVSAGHDRTVRVWSPTTGEQLCLTDIPLPPPSAPAGYMPIELRQLTADGKTLAVTTHDVLTLWDTATGKQLREIKPGKDILRKLALSPNGRIAAVLSGDQKSIGVWDTTAGKELGQVQTPRRVEEFALAPDGALVVTSAGEQSLQVWEVSSGKELRRLDFPPRFLGQLPRSLAFSPDSRTLASGHWDNNVIVWEVASGKVLARFQPQKQESGGTVAFAPDGKTLAIGGERFLRLLDPATGKPLREMPGESRGSVAFSPDGKTLAARGGVVASEIVVWDVATGNRLSPRQGSSGQVWELAIAPDGKALVSYSPSDDTLRLWDTATGEQLRTFGERADLGGCLGYFAIATRDGLSSAVAHAWGNAVVLRDPATGREAGRFLAPPPKPGGQSSTLTYRAVHVSRDGARVMAVAVAGRPDRVSGRLHVWDRASGKLLTDREAPSDYLPCFAPDGRDLVAPREGILRLHDVEKGEDRVTLSPELTLPATFAPDGRFLAVLGRKPRPNGVMLLRGGEVDSVSLVERRTGKPFVRLETGHVARTAVSPDGRFVATAETDAVRVWEVASGKPAFTIRREQTYSTAPAYSFVRCLAFLPDGRSLVTGMSDTTIVVWDLKPRTAPSDGNDLDRHFKELGDEDAATAYRAGWLLAATPERAVSYLRDRLRPARGVDAGQVERLVADLDSDDLTTRAASTKALTAMEELAEPVYRKALESRPSLELRRRVDGLLEKCWASGHGPLSGGEKLRALRAVAVLERVGSHEARRVLRELANGEPAARLTREAKVSLERLGGRRD